MKECRVPSATIESFERAEVQKLSMDVRRRDEEVGSQLRARLTIRRRTSSWKFVGVAEQEQPRIPPSHLPSHVCP